MGSVRIVGITEVTRPVQSLNLTVLFSVGVDDGVVGSVALFAGVSSDELPVAVVDADFNVMMLQLL